MTTFVAASEIAVNSADGDEIVKAGFVFEKSTSPGAYASGCVGAATAANTQINVKSSARVRTIFRLLK